MKKTVIYARVSTERQKEEQTIESQIAVLEEKIKQDGNILIEKYLDEGWSGETVDRPALDKLRADAKNNVFETIYIYHLDRLSRELSNQLYVVGELKRLGIEIYTAQGKLEDDPNNRLLMQMQGIVAEQEKLRILDRTRGGRLQKAKRGVVVGSIAPYGYIYTKEIGKKDGCYVVNKKEAEIIKLIFELFLKFQSVRSVVKELHKISISSPQGGSKWGKSTIHRILTRDDYTGTAYYNKFMAVETRKSMERKYKKIVRTGRRLRDRDQWIPIAVPAIIDNGTFLLAQKILTSNKQKLRRTPKYQYLLSGLVSCEQCGSSFGGNPCHGHLFYRCSNRDKNFPLLRECSSGMINAEKLDNLVWTNIRKVILQPELILRHVDKLIANNQLSAGEINSKIESLNSEADKNKERESKLIDVYSEQLITKQQFIEKVEFLKKERERIVGEISLLAEKKNSSIDKGLAKREIKHFCHLAKKKFDGLDFEARKQFIKLVVDGVVLNVMEKRASIKTIIPFISQAKVGLLATTS
ncbi:MAG: recombinase family protein [bacterium]|nr:recombinase family protein [bacterium]